MKLSAYTIAATKRQVESKHADLLAFARLLCSQGSSYKYTNSPAQTGSNPSTDILFEQCKICLRGHCNSKCIIRAGTHVYWRAGNNLLQIISYSDVEQTRRFFAAVAEGRIGRRLWALHCKCRVIPGLSRRWVPTWVSPAAVGTSRMP